ncbi:hypothetical protein AJ80_06802 [Polytolypa hystricis UAMH7299]|uniref:Thioesterase domain-containing protein n=1 Tax=Polytolypa hystricis (strain UAMH7299) TaxID=1447883 RepID=A0A2B7XU67_POLH7|nr:hypothetical protein AJ80_06802 [Polytolypa hystricis UAMH7299]
MISLRFRSALQSALNSTLHPTPAKWSASSSPTSRIGLSRAPVPRQPTVISQQLRHSSFNQTAPSPRSLKSLRLLRRFLGFSAIAVTALTLGIVCNPNFDKMRNAIASQATDAESLNGYTPSDELAREINEYIDTHPLAQSLRANPVFSEARPHMKIPAAMRAHNLTAGTLAGVDKIAVPPYIWVEDKGKSLVSMLYLGNAVSGHPGIVHGGLIATLLDEALARCCFPALPSGIGVTANLNIDYRSPAPAGSYVVIRAETTKVEGRKAWVKGRVETLPTEEGKDPVVLAEATALFIEPKNAAVCLITPHPLFILV